MKIAIIGAGFFGATAALKLSKYHDVDLFEKKKKKPKKKKHNMINKTQFKFIVN